MADYIAATQKRSAIPDKNVFMASYIRMDIPRTPKDEEAKVNQLKEVANIAAQDLHGSIECDVMVRDGSVIVEAVASGHLHELLSPDNLRAIGISIKESDLVKGLLSYLVIRKVLLILVKDIKAATAALSMHTRWIFKARWGDVFYSESRTGATGNLLRFFDAIDSARTEGISAEKRKNSMGRALRNIQKVIELIDNTEDRKLISEYIKRELKRVKKIDIADLKGKEAKFAAEYNSDLEELTKLIKEL